MKKILWQLNKKVSRQNCKNVCMKTTEYSYNLLSIKDSNEITMYHLISVYENRFSTFCQYCDSILKKSIFYYCALKLTWNWYNTDEVEKDFNSLQVFDTRLKFKEGYYGPVTIF